jgi:exo-1,4-beta-D-glucosaminidase
VSFHGIIQDARRALGDTILRRHNSRIAAAAVFVLIFFFALISLQAHADSHDPKDYRLPLRAGWTLESSCRIKSTGEQISSPGFKTTIWHNASVPSTVLAALVADNTYLDPYFGMNLRSIPGATYPIGKNFAQLPMPANSPFRCSWWYRTEFKLPENFEERHVWLHFSGINYRANIWLNGHLVAGKNDVAGMYRIYDFEVSDVIARDAVNVLAVETFAQTETDLGINWQDWNPAPPDKNLGLYGDVYLQASGPVVLRSPEVVTHFTDSSLGAADLTVIADLQNVSHHQSTIWLDGFIDSIHFRPTIILKPGETRTIRLTPKEFPQLHVEHPAVWWPALLGPQNLHQLSLRVVNGNETSDVQILRFGIREITSELNEKGYCVFRVNGKKILIRGGGWAEDMLLRRSRERLEAQLDYIRDMNLNTIRLEGQIESDDFYDLADEKGILIMPGWVCCSFWQKWDKWKPADLAIAAESQRSQAMRLRSHPSVFVWLYSSDEPPPASVEDAYLKALKDSDWPNPALSSASAIPAERTGPSGMKMKGPYDYVPPSYWLTDPGKYGGAYGFNTETGPGAAIPTADSLKKMLPANRLWPINSIWNFHSASEEFSNLNRFTTAMDSMFGPPDTLETFLARSQLMAYDGERAMFEAYGRNKYTSTGVIQWMLNNAWPSIFWHLYDYYLQPAGGYFGAKKACEPLHVQYSYDDRSVVVVNSTLEKFSGLTVSAALYDFSLQEKSSQHANLDIAEDGVQRVLTIPPPPPESDPAVFFLKLILADSSAKVLSRNFYWLSSRPGKIEWNKTIYFDNPLPPDTTFSASIFTPASPYDDLTALNRLPEARLHGSARVEHTPDGRVRVKMENPGKNLAFQIHLGIGRKGENSEILPVLWEDNYFELMPGESREISARYLSSDVLKGELELRVSGWNIAPEIMPISR